MKPEMRDPRLYSDLERRLKYLEAMVERNFQDNGFIMRQIGHMKYKKVSDGKARRLLRRNRYRWYYHPIKWKLQRFFERKNKNGN